VRKFIYFNKNSIIVEVSFLPMAQIGLSFGEHITFSLGFFVQFYLSFDFLAISSLLYKHNFYDKALDLTIWFNNGGSISVNLFSDTMGWKRGDLNWYFPILGTLKGKAKVTKRVIEERDILIPMSEKVYSAKAILADWTWKYPRWFRKVIRRCEIKIPEGIPHAGKGENSWDCGDDATFGITTGQCKSIPEAVGVLVGSCLKDRVRYGGWKDYNWKREKEQ
jgi:hypothetical protein